MYEEPTGGRAKPSGKAVAGVVIVVVVVIIGFLSLDGGGSGDDEFGNPDGPWQAHAQCANATRDRLSSPASADFPEFDDPGVSISSSGNQWTVVSWVDADNALGTEVRTRFRCVTSDLGDQWRLDAWEEVGGP